MLTTMTNEQLVNLAYDAGHEELCGILAELKRRLDKGIVPVIDATPYARLFAVMDCRDSLLAAFKNFLALDSTGMTEEWREEIGPDSAYGVALAVIEAAEKQKEGESKPSRDTAIRCAYADLVGAYQDHKNGKGHDWKAHLESIRDLESAFPFIQPVEVVE